MTGEPQFELLPAMDLKTANEAVLVANTPSFLFDRLRRDAAVDYVSKTLPASEILENLRFSVTEPLNVQDVVLGYVYLVALTMKPSTEVWPVLERLDLSRLEWGSEIRALMKAEAIPTSHVVMATAGPELKLATAPSDAGTTSTSETLLSNPEGRTIFP